MVDMTQLRKVFYEKLAAENDMDKAFVKAVWVAYQLGIHDAEKDIGVVK